jgi:hypothetical protein
MKRNAALLWSLALGAAVAAAQGGAPPGTAVGRCVGREALAQREIDRLARFFPLGEPYKNWARQNCYPAHLDDVALEGTASPLGFIVTVASWDVFVIDPGPRWLEGCRKSGTVPQGTVPVTGRDILEVKQRIAAHPGLSREDLRELGLGRGQSREGAALYALYLGTAERSVLVECFGDLGATVERAAETLLQGRS